MPKFCANLNFMFTEKPFLDRYKLAAEAGFKAVESGFPPAGTSKQELFGAVQSSGLQQVLLNVYTGKYYEHFRWDHFVNLSLDWVR